MGFAFSFMYFFSVCCSFLARYYSSYFILTLFNTVRHKVIQIFTPKAVAALETCNLLCTSCYPLVLIDLGELIALFIGANAIV